MKKPMERLLLLVLCLGTAAALVLGGKLSSVSRRCEELEFRQREVNASFTGSLVRLYEELYSKDPAQADEERIAALAAECQVLLRLTEIGEVPQLGDITGWLLRQAEAEERTSLPDAVREDLGHFLMNLGGSPLPEDIGDHGRRVWEELSRL